MLSVQSTVMKRGSTKKKCKCKCAAMHCCFLVAFALFFWVGWGGWAARSILARSSSGDFCGCLFFASHSTSYIHTPRPLTIYSFSPLFTLFTGRLPFPSSFSSLPGRKRVRRTSPSKGQHQLLPPPPHHPTTHHHPHHAETTPPPHAAAAPAPASPSPGCC